MTHQPGPMTLWCVQTQNTAVSVGIVRLRFWGMAVSAPPMQIKVILKIGESWDDMGGGGGGGGRKAFCQWITW